MFSFLCPKILVQSKCTAWESYSTSKLGGKVCIKGLEDVTSSDEAQGANLVGKKDLQELCLVWYTQIFKRPSLATNVEQEQITMFKKAYSSSIFVISLGAYHSVGKVYHLTSLEVLHIQGCPALIEWCKEGTREDWD
ncbi:hypothetical protein VNO77_31825 [Canavalia gladiata]|uniref:R13L1/DRL21-like LRR repeat region domain-containing protein n=1 Tax=Canavalia gladiata TaxID=3824 RepID=A0AAN9KPH1_CANGL